MAERLFQIGIKALATDDKGRILLLKSLGSDGSERWDFPGGRMDENETFQQTLSRELLEEIGMDYIGDPQPFDSILSKVSIATDKGSVGLVLLVYKVQLPAGSPIQLNDYEVDFGWYSPLEAANMIANKYPSEFTEQITGL